MASHTKPIKSDIKTSLSSLGSTVDPHNKAGSASDEPVIGSEGRDKKLDDTRGGFVLKANSEELPENRRKTLASKSSHNLKRTFMSVSTRAAKIEPRRVEGAGS
jgi:junctophilin